MTLPNYEGWAPRHVSYSTINGYRSCARRLLLEKVYRVESIPGLAAIGGNAVHSASELIDLYILEHGMDALTSEDITTLDTTRKES